MNRKNRTQGLRGGDRPDPAYQNWTNVAGQPVVRLVAMLEESVAYDRPWTLPFHALSFSAPSFTAAPSVIRTRS